MKLSISKNTKFPSPICVKSLKEDKQKGENKKVRRDSILLFSGGGTTLISRKFEFFSIFFSEFS